MTSIYRQVGIGAERLFREVLIDNLALTEDQATWLYETSSIGGKIHTLYLDGRVEFAHALDDAKRQVISEWMARAASEVSKEVARVLEGVAFDSANCAVYTN